MALLPKSRLPKIGPSDALNATAVVLHATDEELPRALAVLDEYGETEVANAVREFLRLGDTLCGGNPPPRWLAVRLARAILVARGYMPQKPNSSLKKVRRGPRQARTRASANWRSG